MKFDRTSAGYLLALASAATGAVRYNLAVYTKETARIDYVVFLAYALAVGVLCSTIHVVAREGTRGFVPLRGRWRHALLYGALMGWGTLTHFLALDYLNEVVMTSVAQTSVLLTITLAVWILGERFTLLEWGATAVIIAGMFLLEPWEGANLTGFLILMSGLLTSALATIGAKRWVQGIPPQTLTVWRNVVALAIVGAYALARPRAEFTVASALAVVAAGVFGPYLHGLFFLQSLQRIDASKASLMNRVQPAIVFVLSWLLLDRLPDERDRWSALILVLGTMLLAAVRPRK